MIDFLALFKVVDQFARRRITLLRILGERLHDQRIDAGMNLAIQRNGVGRHFIFDLINQSNRIFRVKSPAPRDHFIENCAHGKQIRALIHRFAANLLRRAVRHQPSQAIARFCVDEAHARNAVSDHFDQTIPLHDDLVRLE